MGVSAVPVRKLQPVVKTRTYAYRSRLKSAPVVSKRRSVARPPRVRRRRPLVRRWFLFLLFVLGQMVFFSSSLFTVHTIRVTGSKHVSRQAILEQSGLSRGMSLWALSPDLVQRRLASLYQLAQARVSFDFPGRVTIRVQERKPRYLVAMEGADSKWYEVGHDGMVLRPARGHHGLPRLVIDSAVIPGIRIDEAAIFAGREAAAWLSGVLPRKARFYQVDQRDAVSVKTTFEGVPVTIRLGQIERMDYKVRVLKAMLARLKKHRQRVSLIDLRFNSPVVRLFKAPKSRG